MGVLAKVRAWVAKKRKAKCPYTSNGIKAYLCLNNYQPGILKECKREKRCSNLFDTWMGCNQDIRNEHERWLKEQ